MKTFEWKLVTAFCLLSFIIGLLIFPLCCKDKPVQPEVKIEKTIEYVKGNVVHDTISKPVPYFVEVPVEIEVPIYLTSQDTMEIVADYFLKRFYELDFSNDTLGTFKVDATVHKNELQTAISSIQPIVKKETTTITKTEFLPLSQRPLYFYTVIGSSIDFKTNKVSAGMEIKQKWLVGVSAMRFDENFGYTIDLGIKF